MRYLKLSWFYAILGVALFLGAYLIDRAYQPVWQILLVAGMYLVGFLLFTVVSPLYWYRFKDGYKGEDDGFVRPITK